MIGHVNVLKASIKIFEVQDLESFGVGERVEVLGGDFPGKGVESLCPFRVPCPGICIRLFICVCA